MSLALVLFRPVYSYGQAGVDPHVIKLATLAPSGTPWVEVLEDVAQDWREISHDRVQLRLYPNGVVGDEGEMVLKMRIDQIQAAALTAQGLGHIDTGVWGLSMPLLARNYDELDWIRSQVSDTLSQRFWDAGFIILAWVDIGWVYWFARSPVRIPDDLRELRIFLWAGGVDDEGIWERAGFTGISLSAVDILMAFQTGLIDAISVSPLTAASFQWFTIAKYMTSLRWAALSGAVIVRKDTWESIPAALRDRLQSSVDEHTREFQDRIRAFDDEAVKVMREHGLEIIETTPAEEAEWQKQVDEYYSELRGTLVDEAMYDRVMELRKLIRSGGAAIP